MKAKLLSILALLLVAATGAFATETTVTWSKTGGKFYNGMTTLDGVTISGSSIHRNDFEDWQIDSGTFTTDLGNFTKIELTGGYTEGFSGNGWSGRTWTGNASSVSFEGFLADFGNDSFTITFTIGPAPTKYNVTLAEGTEDADNWTISPNPAEEGQAITITYSGTKKVKSVKAVKKAAAPAGPTAYTLAESTVGMIVGTDGKAYAAADKDNLPSGVTAVAMVAYKSATAGSSLAIALADEGSMNWATAKSTCEGKTAIGDYSWKLPNKTEWKQMLSTNGGNEGSYTGLNTALATAGGDSSKLQEKKYYWSSSVFSGDNPDEVFFINGGVEWSWNSPGTSDLVRACLAF